MLLRAKISLFTVGALAFLATVIVWFAAEVMDGILIDMNVQVMQLELENIAQRLERRHQTLVQARVDKIEAYVEAAREKEVNALGQYRYGRAGRLLLFDATRQRVLPPTPEKPLLPSDTWERIGTASQGHFQAVVDGEARFFTYRRFPDWGWTLFIAAPERELLAARTHFVKVVAAFTLLLVAAVLAASYFLSQILARRLDTILSAVRSVEEGRLDVALGVVNPRDEIGLLEKGIGDMIQQRRQDEDALRRHQETLESEVKARTSDLETTNAALRDEMEAHRQTEQHLIRAERLAAIGTLTAGIAHEFNNINAVVLGYLDLLRNDPKLPEEFQELLEIVIQSVHRSTGITQKLLLFSGKSATHKRRLSLNDVVRQTVDLVRAEFASEGIAIETELADDLPLLLVEDIGQVVLNLLVNARHALLTRPHKRIAIQTGRTEDEIFIRVSDTGCGIGPEELPNIFTPFFSTKGEYARRRTPQSRVKGTGLGLSISDTIVRENGGHIQVESELDVGTTFTVRLPLNPNEGNEALQEGEQALRQAPASDILVVDDEPYVCGMLEKTLAEDGHRVQSANNGHEAESLLARCAFDLIVTDLQMPDMHGLDFLRRLSENPLIKEIPVVVLTGCASPRAMLEEENLEVDALLQKPMRIHDLRDTINRLLVRETLGGE